MIRVGIVDFDTSHVAEFTRRLNRAPGTPEDSSLKGPASSPAAPEPR
jgi:hypothetical protein